MAKGRASSVAKMPDALARGKNIYPIIPYRSRLALSADGAANNSEETVDFDLQFENNEVIDIFDVVMMYDMEFDNLADGLNNIASFLALLEDPDRVSTTDISTENFFETDPSLVVWDIYNIITDFDTSGMALSEGGARHHFKLPQPYTVARNVKWIAQADWTEADVVVCTISCEIWGRRRVASDAEFKNIIYRQRF